MKYEVTIVRTVPSYRERVVVLVEAPSKQAVEEMTLPDDISDLEDEDVLEWEEVMEGHGGFPCDYDIQSIDQIEDDTVVDIQLED
jgi:hypothetical protein